MSDELETITIGELTEASSIGANDRFIIENASQINKKVSPSTVTNAIKSNLTTAEQNALSSGITPQKVVDLDELLTKTIAEIDDARATTENAYSASKTLHVPTVVVSDNADAEKTIDAYYQADGVSVKVLFLNGHSGATFTINGKTVYANKDGVAVAVPSHTINSVDWYVQAYTTLELVYLSSLDDGNGGWLVVGNPIVLSNYSEYQSYEIKANGWMKQRQVLTNGNNSKTTVPFLIPFTSVPMLCCIPHYDGSSQGERRMGYSVTNINFICVPISYQAGTYYSEWIAEGY